MSANVTKLQWLTCGLFLLTCFIGIRVEWLDAHSGYKLTTLLPVIKTMRGLCFASHLKRVLDEVRGRPVSLGGFSEAQGVSDPELRRQVFLELSGEISTSWGDDRLTHPADRLKLVDGSLRLACRACI